MSDTLIGLTSGGGASASIRLPVDVTVYPLPVLLRALHSLAPRIVGRVSRQGGEACEVELLSGAKGLLTAHELESSFLLALGDFVLRDRLEAETFEIRTLVVRQAFERSNLQWPLLDEAAPGQDPLGLGNPDPETGRSVAH